MPGPPLAVVPLEHGPPRLVAMPAHRPGGGMKTPWTGTLPEEPVRLGAERIGAYLARERELRGVTLEELARQTRIPLRSLQRLESGAFDRNPDGFARGFVRTVALALGLPVEETIAKMLPETDLAEDGAAPPMLLRLVQLLGLAIVLGAVAGSFWIWLTSPRGETIAPVFQSREDGLVVRRDAVRALAEQHGLLVDASGGTFLPGADTAPAPMPAADAPADGSDAGEPGAPPPAAGAASGR